MGYKTIIEEFRELTEDIATVESCITSVEREIKKAIMIYRPHELGAIEYDKPSVQTSMSQDSIFMVMIKLHDLQTDLEDLQTELESLNKQRNKLEKVIIDLGITEKMVMMLRIKGCSNQKIADTLNYSVKGIEKIFQRIKRKSLDY